MVGEGGLRDMERDTPVASSPSQYLASTPHEPLATGRMALLEASVGIREPPLCMCVCAGALELRTTLLLPSSLCLPDLLPLTKRQRLLIFAG